MSWIKFFKGRVILIVRAQLQYSFLSSLFAGNGWIVIALVVWGFAIQTQSASPSAPERFTVATYNLENYLTEPKGTRRAKSESSKAQVRKVLGNIKADILALQELGSLEALDELRRSLAQDGWEYRFSDFVQGWDTNIFVGILSRFEIASRRPHTNVSYVLNGRRLHVSRGFAEVDIQVTPQYRLTVMAAHLKSRRTTYVADEAQMREQEAIKLREILDQRLASQPRLNLVVLGDLNDSPDSKTIRQLIGRGKDSLVDLEPFERNGDSYLGQGENGAPRRISWTHYYSKEDSYGRIDYILVSRGMAAEWERSGSYVVSLPNWGLASDHRPVVAEFVAKER